MMEMPNGPGDFSVTIPNGSPVPYNGTFEIDNGTLHVVSTAGPPTHFWYSPSGWLSIEKRT
jgi:hypothetical protein